MEGEILRCGTEVYFEDSQGGSTESQDIAGTDMVVVFWGPVYDQPHLFFTEFGNGIGGFWADTESTLVGIDYTDGVCLGSTGCDGK